MTRPRLLDLFCCEGGAGVGYQRAGFDVFGVDRSAAHLRRYPFPAHLGDALAYAEKHGREFDVIHASPPCQIHSPSTSRNQGRTDTTGEMFDVDRHVDLVPATREILNHLGVPYVIENVPGAGLDAQVMLCGSMFDLGCVTRDGWRQLRRHRDFESTVPLLPPKPCNHVGLAVSVYGNGGGTSWAKGYAALLDEALTVMGTPWMSRKGVSEAIPPDYTEWIGAHLLDHITAPLSA